MELLVVIGIIVLMTAMSLPAISKFLDGQSLQQSGRILQSAFNDARRAAITQRTKQYLVFFRETEKSTGEMRYGVRRFRDKFGYEGEAHYLLPNTMIDIADSSTITRGTASPTPDTATVIGRARGLEVPIFEPMPAETDAIFGATRTPTLTGGNVWIQFHKDGTVEVIASPPSEKPPTGAAAKAFDLNEVLEPTQKTFDEITAGVDLNVREASDNQNIGKRCFIDLDPNTGRVSIRVVEVLDPS